jgi:polar amino acid transport system permease protein
LQLSIDVVTTAQIMDQYLEFLQKYGPRIIDGSIVTVQLSVLASLFAIGIALSIGFLRVAPHRLPRAIAMIYIEFFRGTSLIVQLYWVFFVLPLFGLTLDKFLSGFVTVGLCLGGYGAELVRGAIQSVPQGQYEAALALNMSPLKRMTRIIFPQALLIMLPAWGNLFIELLKATALVALISVPELMFETKQVNNITFMSVQCFGTALIVYYLMARLVITPSMRTFESFWAKRMGRV